jgi:[NiFe] hydrogenase diaphorase moiety large subunit
MSNRKAAIDEVLERYQRDASRLLDILWACQEDTGYVSGQDLQNLAAGLAVSVPHIEEVLSYYHFFRDAPAGRHSIYLDNSIIAQHAGMAAVKNAFENELGIRVGEVSPDGLVGLFETSCIGMSDQAPAALIDLVPVTKLTAARAREICRDLKAGMPISSKIDNHLQNVGLFIDWSGSRPLPASRAASLSAEHILDELKASGLRGRGGAGFPTAKKWELCRSFPSPTKYVVCNADEGEPGTFKDRALLTELPETLLEGMAIAGKCIGANEGIIYLRAEYRYLLAQLNETIAHYSSPVHPMRFRVQLGAGAYVCGEESALLESMEGKRGEPRIKPPFPVEQGYEGCPTVVNNVETFVLAAEIMRKSAAEFRSHGTEQSPGVRLLSVAGDVDRPGIYELPWGVTVAEVLTMVGARDPLLIQVGGPSGICISVADAGRRIAFEDLPTGGSFMVFSGARDKFGILLNFMDFFVAESCGNCTPCRAGNVILRDLLQRFQAGQAGTADLDKLTQWLNIVSRTSRCGLGATSPNVITTSLQAFPDLYRSAIAVDEDARFHHFDLAAATSDYDQVIKGMSSTGEGKHE